MKSKSSLGDFQGGFAARLPLGFLLVSILDTFFDPLNP